MSRLLSALVLTLGLAAPFVAPAPSHAALLPPDTDVRGFVLESTDVGLGFRLNTEQSGLRPNEATANREDVQRYQQWGRIGGYHAQFERESALVTAVTGSAVIVQAVSLYRGVDGAHAAFEYSRERNGQRMELLGTPQIGEASLAFRMRQQAAGMGQSVASPPADVVIIQFRKGNLVQTVVATGPQGAPVWDEAFATAQLAASRVPD